MAYCTAADVYAHGVPREAIQHPGRLAASVSAAADTIELDGHGFADGDPVSFRAAADGSLPSPLAEGTTYYAIVVDDSHFQVATAAGGSAVNLTTAGTDTVVIAPLPIASAIAWAERIIDDLLPAHVVPLTDPVPEIVRVTCAELAGGKLLALSGGVSRTLGEIVDGARKRLERWSRGVPIRGTNAPTSAGLATSSVSHTDSRGWYRYGGI